MDAKKKSLEKRDLDKVGGKGLHPRNLHNFGYDYHALYKAHPALKAHLQVNRYGDESIDFADAVAVKALNCALLKHHYGVDGWDIPEGFLCPPIPGRVDYLHYVADLLGVSGAAAGATAGSAAGDGSAVRMLDIGTGANGIYALLASRVYGWRCTACDIDPESIENLSEILSKNLSLGKRIELRLQTDNGRIFEGIIRPGEYYDLSVCNPPFHASLEEALKGSQKKRDNLAANRKMRGGERGEGI